MISIVSKGRATCVESPGFLIVEGLSYDFEERHDSRTGKDYYKVDVGGDGEVSVPFGEHEFRRCFRVGEAESVQDDPLSLSAAADAQAAKEE